MSSIDRPGAELRRQSACRTEAARALHELVKDTRRMVEETERLLESPLWREFAVHDPQPQEKAPPEAEGADSFD